MKTNIRVDFVTVGPIRAHCYLVWSTDNMCGVLIDTGYDPEKILSMVEKNKVKISFMEPFFFVILNCINVEAIYLTHGHLDHTGAAEELHEQLHIPIFGHSLDEAWYKDTTCISMMGMPKARPLTKVNPIKDGDEVNFGNVKVKVIHTPGHTAGSVCYLLKDTNTLFSGDTLFRRSIGRTDLPGGNSDEIRKSIKNKLFKLPDSVRVYPGHNNFTSIGYEKENNMIV